MNVPLILRILGGLLLFLGVAILLSLPCAIIFHPAGRFADGGFWPLAGASAITFAIGFTLFRSMRVRRDMSHREAFVVVTFAWLSFAAFGALPYLFSGVLTNPADAFFESMSGFSTTGSSVIRDLSIVPRSILFWRAMTQWLGGMGIIVLGIAILPFLGVSGMQLFNAEVSGPTADRLSPRIQDTAKALWGVYVALTALLTGLLWLGGLPLFEAVCHAFTTLASGGFSTENASVGAYTSPFVHWTIILFMFITGMSYTLIYCVFKGHPRRLLQSEELRLYALTVFVAVAVIVLFNAPGYDRPFKNLTDATFQVVSLMSTTGYVTADYERWPFVTQLILVLVTFIGGCAGSTSGGLKVVRVRLVLRQMGLQVSRLIHPREVSLLKLDGHPVPPTVVLGVNSFICAFVAVFLAASLLLTALGIDIITAGTAVITCMSGCGPALGSVGPMDNFAHLPGLGKIILSICMLVGRLEIFTVLVLFNHSFWKR